MLFLNNLQWNFEAKRHPRPSFHQEERFPPCPTFTASEANRSQPLVGQSSPYYQNM